MIQNEEEVGKIMFQDKLGELDQCPCGSLIFVFDPKWNKIRCCCCGKVKGGNNDGRN